MFRSVYIFWLAFSIDLEDLSIETILSVSHLNMALRLRSEPEWTEYLKTTVGLHEDQSTAYGKIFNDNHFTEETLSELSKDILRELGITVLGDVLNILKKCKPQAGTAQAASSDSPPVVKPPPPKLPLLTMETTKPQWRKFLIDWTSFKNITQLAECQIASQLYAACDETVQMSLINTVSDVFGLSEEELLKEIETIVTQKSNPTVHRMAFRQLFQGPSETVQDYVIRLKSNAVDCEYSCEKCKHDLTTVHVKDQFISGLHNELLQTDILTKANQLKDLNLVVQHAEAFESALRDQSKLSSHHEESVSRISDHRKNKKNKYRLPNNPQQQHQQQYQQQPQQQQPQQQQPQQQQQQQPPFNNNSDDNIKKCTGCGSTSHGSHERETKCTAWGTLCLYCHKPNHSAEVCKKKISEGVNAIHIGRIAYDSATDKFTSLNKEVTDIPAELTPFTSQNRFNNTPVKTDIFPDSGASACVGGRQHQKTLGVPDHCLIPTDKPIVAVGGTKLKCYGWIPMKFCVGGHVTRQPLFICDKVDKLYFSRKACIDTKILPESFPYPMDWCPATVASIRGETDITNECNTSNVPARPAKIPFAPTQDNIP